MAERRHGRRQAWIPAQPGGARRARPIRGGERHVRVTARLLADPTDIKFALDVCRLWQDGPQTLVALFTELACLHMLRTELERLLARYIEGGR